jgi:hypothetical protein
MNALSPLAEDDDSADYHASKVQFNCKKFQEYVIGVGSADAFGGNIVLNRTFRGNVTAASIVSPPSSQTVNRGAPVTFRVNANNPQTAVVYQWYKNDQPISGANTATFTIPSVADSDVGTYNCKISTSQTVTWSDDAELQINTEGSTAQAKAKLVRALSTGITGGTVAPLSAMSAHKVHAFDISASAGYSGTQVFQNYPGKDPGEPNACGVIGGSSYWLSYTAPANGVLTMNTDGSTFDTVMAVYVDNGANAGYSSLVSVACDNNSGSNGKTSKVVFNVTANQVYYIQIDGVNGACGTVYLNYSLNTPPTVSAIASVTMAEDSAAPSRSFTISDRETAASSLQVTATSSNPTLFPSGSLVVSGTTTSRTISLQPAQYKYGSATITVTVRDAGGLTATTSFPVTVTAVNHAPVANSDSFSCKVGSTLTIAASSLLANDSDVDADPLSVYSASTSSNLGGKVSLSGSYIYYTAPATTATSDYFSYTVSDGRGGYATGRVFITLTQ